LEAYLANSDADKSEINYALLDACKNGYVGVVKLLLDNGADVKYSNDGFTALHFAMRSGNKEIVKMLLAHGADTEARDKSGRRPIFIARQLHYDEIVEMLIEAGSYPY